MAKELTNKGQIKDGDTVVLAYKGEAQVHTGVVVLNAGTDQEEILLDAKKNTYFITSMAMDGTSWAKDVKYINDQYVRNWIVRMDKNINNALILLDRALEEIEYGFVACETCGDQEDTKSLDFVDDLKMARSELLVVAGKGL